MFMAGMGFDEVVLVMSSTITSHVVAALLDLLWLARRELDMYFGSIFHGNYEGPDITTSCSIPGTKSANGIQQVEYGFNVRAPRLASGVREQA
jgi:hypothetical protein